MYVRMEIVNNSLSCCSGEFMYLLHFVLVVCLLVCLLAFVSVCLFVSSVGYLFRVWESSGTSCNSCISLPAQPHISTLEEEDSDDNSDSDNSSDPDVNSDSDDNDKDKRVCSSWQKSSSWQC